MVDPSGKPILDSWKEIARYLNREVRTCQRWQKDLGLPVYHIDENSPRSKVFAYKSEIDQWLKDKTVLQPLPGNGGRGLKPWLIGAIVLGASLLVAGTVKIVPILIPEKGTSIALLPLTNANPSGDDNYLSEEMARVIADSLPVPKKLKIIPAFAVRGLLGNSADLREVARRLGADYVLRATLEKGNPGITVAAELVRPGDGSVIWKGQFQEPFDNAFAIPDGISAGVRKTLKIKNAGAPRKSLEARDDQAVDSYLKGDFILGRLNGGNDDSWRFYHKGEYYAGRFTAEANEVAIKMFTEAAAIEPDFALAYVGLASCYANYINFGWRRSLEWLDKAETLLRKAQALSPDLAEYYTILIMVKLLKDSAFGAKAWDDVPGLVAEGLGKHPEDARLNSICGQYYFLKFGREGGEADFRKARELKEKAFWLNPYHVANVVYSSLLMLDGNFDEALEVCRLVEKLDTTSSVRLFMGEIFFYKGDLAAGEAIYKNMAEAPELVIRIDALCQLARIYARRGEAGRARDTLKEVMAISPEKLVYSDVQFSRASAWAWLGEKELAVKALEDFLNVPWVWRKRYIHGRYMALDEALRPLRSEPTIKAIFDRKREGESDGKK